MFQMPAVPIISPADGVYEAFGKIQGYLNALERQLRYRLNNIGAENINPAEAAELGTLLMKGQPIDASKIRGSLENIPWISRIKDGETASQVEFRIGDSAAGRLRLEKTESGYVLRLETEEVNGAFPDVRIRTGGNASVEAGGNLTASAGGNVMISGGNITVTGEGDMTVTGGSITVSGGDTISINTSGTVTIDGADGVNIGAEDTRISLVGNATLNGKRLRTYT